MTEFKFGDEVYDAFNKRRGIVINSKLLSMTSALWGLIDESGARWAVKDRYLVKLAPAGRPGIGAVVAMVAASQTRWQLHALLDEGVWGHEASFSDVSAVRRALLNIGKIPRFRRGWRVVCTGVGVVMQRAKSPEGVQP
jgi:hypothetical protein